MRVTGLVGHGVAMLGAGLIGDQYIAAIQNGRSRDRVAVVFSRSAAGATRCAERHGVANWSTDIEEAVNRPDVDVVVVALPNDQHERAVQLAAAAGKAILCTKPLGRTAAEARRMLEVVESAGVFAGYLEDLTFSPKATAAAGAVRDGLLGRILTVRCRDAHAGPHSPWFLNAGQAGGGVLLDLGSHCVEVARGYIGKQDPPREVICHTAALVHDVGVEDTAIALIRFASGAVAQVDVSWTVSTGMELRDEIHGSHGTVHLEHLQNTGFRTSSWGVGDSSGDAAWQFPVPDEMAVSGNAEMFVRMFEAMDAGLPAQETFYDGYVVNEVLDACYRSATSRQWEPVELHRWGHHDREGATASNTHGEDA